MVESVGLLKLFGRFSETPNNAKKAYKTGLFYTSRLATKTS